MKYKKVTVFFFFFSILLIDLYAQEISPIDAQEKRLKEMERTASLLTTTRESKATIIDEYYALQQQINQREKLIGSIQQEINKAANKMESSALAVDSLELEIDKLKIEYGTMIRQAFRSKISNNELLFLFSAGSFDQALKRWRYIQQYGEYRKKQIRLILETQSVLKEQIIGLEQGKSQQERLLQSEESQNIAIQEAIGTKSKLLNKLKKEERFIAALLKEQKIAHEALSQALSSVIFKDIGTETVDKDFRETTADSPPPKKILSTAITYQFSQKKGKMPWPIKNGVITRYFGNQAHPIHKKIVINNNGIDIKARSKRSVFSLEEGIVTAIQVVPGYLNTLILQHGDYYSVYSNLETIKVKKGDIVFAQQTIGEVGINTRKDYPELHLEIWKGKIRLNPINWLKPL